MNVVYPNIDNVELADLAGCFNRNIPNSKLNAIRVFKKFSPPSLRVDKVRYFKPFSQDKVCQWHVNYHAAEENVVFKLEELQKYRELIKKPDDVIEAQIGLGNPGIITVMYNVVGCNCSNTFV